MEFTDFYFLTLFLPIVMAVRYCIPEAYRNVALLLLSYIFYAWGNPVNLIVLLALTGINYACAFKRSGQIAAIIINLLSLASFKYILGAGHHGAATAILLLYAKRSGRHHP